MLYTYDVPGWYMHGLTVNAVADYQQCRRNSDWLNSQKLVATKIKFESRNQKATSYRSHTSTPEKTGARERIHCALMRMFPSLDNCTIRTLTRLVMRAANHVALDRDQPNTHLAFSPTGVGRRDYKRRRSLTFAKFLRRKCAHVFAGQFVTTDSQLELGANAFQLVPTIRLQPKFVTGLDAFSVYRDNDSVLHSCMTDSDIAKHHFEVNPELLRLIVCFGTNGKLALRAKLWRNQDQTHFLDRIYIRHADESLCQHTEEKIREWLRFWLTSNAIVLSDSYDIVMRHDAGEDMPYLDRVRQYDRVSSTHVRLHEGGYYSADNTDGRDNSVKHRGQRSCCCCDERLHADDMRTNDDGDIYCESCYDDIYTRDDITNDEIRCEDAVSLIDGSTTHQDNATELSRDFYHRWGIYALNDDVCEDYAGRIILKEDAISLHNYDEAHKDDPSVVELDNGDFALSEETCQTEFGAVELQSDCVRLTDDYGNEVWILACDAVGPEPELLDHATRDWFEQSSVQYIAELTGI